MWMRICVVSIIAVCCAALLGCSGQLPSDPSHTLDRVAGGTLRVGVSPEAGLVKVAEEGPSGPLAETVERFAESIDATPVWVTHSEERLVRLLEEHELDLAVGSFTEQTPWVDRVGVTRGFSVPSADDTVVVFLVPAGENAFLSRLEGFLDRESAQ